MPEKRGAYPKSGARIVSWLFRMACIMAISTNPPLIIPTTAPISIPKNGTKKYRNSILERKVSKTKTDRHKAIPQLNPEANSHRAEPGNLLCKARNCRMPVIVPPITPTTAALTQMIPEKSGMKANVMPPEKKPKGNPIVVASIHCPAFRNLVRKTIHCARPMKKPLMSRSVNVKNGESSSGSKTRGIAPSVIPMVVPMKVNSDHESQTDLMDLNILKPCSSSQLTVSVTRWWVGRDNAIL